MLRFPTTFITVLSIGLLGTVGVSAQSPAATPMGPAPFSASINCSDETPTFATDQADRQYAPDITVMTLGTPTWSMAVTDASDPRLAGDATFAMNGDLYWHGVVGDTADASFADILVGTLRIDNQQGSWQGSTNLLNLDGESQFPADVVTLVGDGSYAGLVALTEMRQGENLCHWTLKGVIVEGELPTAPSVGPTL